MRGLERAEADVCLSHVSGIVRPPCLHSSGRSGWIVLPLGFNICPVVNTFSGVFALKFKCQVLFAWGDRARFTVWSTWIVFMNYRPDTPHPTPTLTPTPPLPPLVSHFTCPVCAVLRLSLSPLLLTFLLPPVRPPHSPPSPQPLLLLPSGLPHAPSEKKLLNHVEN